MTYQDENPFDQALGVAELYDFGGIEAHAFALGHLDGERPRGWRAYVDGRTLIATEFLPAYDRGYQAGAAVRPKLAWEA